MHLKRCLAALVALSVCVGMAYVAQDAAPAGAKMTAAAQDFLAKLSPEQKAKATFTFDDTERTNWHFIPLQDRDKKSTRKGLPLEEMTAEQKQAALQLLKASTSDVGFQRATTVMSLEAILRELEKNGNNVRNPEWYFFTIFGVPDAKSKWGFRVEGHHVSLNLTVDRGKIMAATPAFLGANPALVKQGDKKGLRILGEIEDAAQDLFKSLRPEQQKVALQSKNFDDVKAQNKKPDVGMPVGIAAQALDSQQMSKLNGLILAYLKTLPQEVSAAEAHAIQKAGPDKIHFAYAGGMDAGQQHSFRVYGPTFVAEFLNVQADSANNPANHIHTCWRSMSNDFGMN